MVESSVKVMVTFQDQNGKNLRVGKHSLKDTLKDVRLKYSWPKNCAFLLDGTPIVDSDEEEITLEDIIDGRKVIIQYI